MARVVDYSGEDGEDFRQSATPDSLGIDTPHFDTLHELLLYSDFVADESSETMNCGDENERRTVAESPLFNLVVSSDSSSGEGMITLTFTYSGRKTGYFELEINRESNLVYGHDFQPYSEILDLDNSHLGLGAISYLLALFFLRDELYVSPEALICSKIITDDMTGFLDRIGLDQVSTLEESIERTEEYGQRAGLFSSEKIKKIDAALKED